MPSETAPHDASSRRRTVVISAGVLLLMMLVLLVVAAVRFASAADAADESRADLERAVRAIGGGDVGTAQEAVASARRHVDDAASTAQGWSGDVWRWVPVAGGAVRDARHLVDALDEITGAAEVGVDLLPSVAGERATLFDDGRVDRGVLDRVVNGTHEISDSLQAAQHSLGEVQGDTPVVGARIAEGRDAALARLDGPLDRLAAVEPAVDELPKMLGFEGPRRYLVALLNPADQRYSSGTPLAFARMTWSGGVLDVSDSLDLRANPRLIEPITWPRVRGNYFHYPKPIQVRNATFAPSWSVGGEELIRGWKAATGQGHDGVLAIDVVALSQLFEISGDVNVPGLGSVSADNLVQQLVGNYDAYYPDANQLDLYAAGIIEPFQQRLLDGGDYLRKLETLGEAAAGRHLAFYSRNRAVQRANESLGIDGDLADPGEGDYLGVFTQSVLPSKSDYWQERATDVVVDLREDGSADHRLTVDIHNDSPPYAVPGTDPGEGYFTRWTGFALGVFVPRGAQVQRVETSTQQDEDDEGVGFVGRFYKHNFFYRNVLLEPQARARLSARYSVADAATTTSDGSLTYRLALDPQGLVRDQAVSVSLRLPAGYRAVDLPAGWTTAESGARYEVADLEASEEWEIRAVPVD